MESREALGKVENQRERGGALGKPVGSRSGTPKRRFRGAGLTVAYFLLTMPASYSVRNRAAAPLGRRRKTARTDYAQPGGRLS